MKPLIDSSSRWLYDRFPSFAELSLFDLILFIATSALVAGSLLLVLQLLRRPRGVDRSVSGWLVAGVWLVASVCACIHLVQVFGGKASLHWSYAACAGVTVACLATIGTWRRESTHAQLHKVDGHSSIMIAALMGVFYIVVLTFTAAYAAVVTGSRFFYVKLALVAALMLGIVRRIWCYRPTAPSPIDSQAATRCLSVNVVEVSVASIGDGRASALSRLALPANQRLIMEAERRFGSPPNQTKTYARPSKSRAAPATITTMDFFTGDVRLPVEDTPSNPPLMPHQVCVQCAASACMCEEWSTFDPVSVANSLGRGTTAKPATPIAGPIVPTGIRPFDVEAVLFELELAESC